MENVLTITNLKPNIIEFNAGLEGLRDNDMKVRLIIEANGMDLGFDAKRIKDTLWEVVIPPLPMLDRTAYPFRMDVVSEGYFFDPLHGTMNVVGTHEMYVTDPKNKNIPSDKVEELPQKHKAKPLGTKEEEEVATDKVAPKVLKPEETKKDKPKKSDNAVADSMARLKAIAAGTAEKAEEVVKAAEVVVDAEKKEDKNPTIKKLEAGSANKNSDKKSEEIVDSIIKKVKDKVNDEEKPKEETKPEKVIEAAPVVEPEAKKDDTKKAEPEVKTFEEALEKVSKPIPKKKRAPKKVSAKPKAGTIKKITENKEIVQKPEDEVELEAKKEETVKGILSEDEETKKVLTHPIKKGGKVTIH